MKLGPFRFSKIAIALFRVSAGPALTPAVQGELLRELHREYPSLTQIPEGVLFSDAPKGRAFVIDRAKLELSEDSPASVALAIDRMRDDLRKTIQLLAFPPPYRLQVVGEGTIQALEGLDPVSALKTHAPPRDGWDGIAGRCNFAGVRYVFGTSDGERRDLRVEPLFAQPDKFYLSIVSTGEPQGVQSLDEAIAHARREAELMERLSDRITADIAGA